jgi:hypothetical protein
MARRPLAADSHPGKIEARRVNSDGKHALLADKPV